MRTYAIRGARTKTTGHYRQPGTRTTFCNKPVGIPNGDFLGLTGWKMCTRCVKAEQRDRAHAVEVAAQVAETVEPLAFLRTAVQAEQGEWNTDRVTALFEAAGINTDRNNRWGLLRHLAEAEHLLTPTDTRGSFTAATAEQAAAAVEARYGAELVTEAEATAGTWRGEWIGHAAADGTLFTLTPDREQGALFA